MQEIPNSQEIFVYRDNGATIIIDILQRVNIEDPEAAAKFVSYYHRSRKEALTAGYCRFHLDAIAEENDAMEHHSVVVQRPTVNELSPIVLDGRQVLKKAGSIHHLRTLFALFRIKGKNHDVVVSFSIPIETHERNGAVTAEQEQESDFYRVVESLRIVDYNLFAV